MKTFYCGVVCHILVYTSFFSYYYGVQDTISESKNVIEIGENYRKGWEACSKQLVCGIPGHGYRENCGAKVAPQAPQKKVAARQKKS